MVTKESKVAIAIAVKAGKTQIRARWENASVGDMSVAVTYLEIIKKRHLQDIENINKKK